MYRLTADPLLGGAVVLSWAVSVGILLRIHRLYPGDFTGDGWKDGRWTGLGVGVLGISVFEGLRMVPVSDEYLLGIVMLTLGVASAGFFTGTIAQIERQDRTRNRSTPDDAAASPSSEG